MDVSECGGNSSATLLTPFLASFNREAEGCSEKYVCEIKVFSNSINHLPPYYHRPPQSNKLLGGHRGCALHKCDIIVSSSYRLLLHLLVRERRRDIEKDVCVLPGWPVTTSVCLTVAFLTDQTTAKTTARAGMRGRSQASAGRVCAQPGSEPESWWDGGFLWFKILSTNWMPDSVEKSLQ